MNTLAAREAMTGEAPDVGAVLADTFIEDPVLSFLFPDAGWRPALLAAFFANRLAAGYHLDHVLVPDSPGVPGRLLFGSLPASPATRNPTSDRQWPACGLC